MPFLSLRRRRRPVVVSMCVVVGLLIAPPQRVQASDPAKAKEVLDGFGTVIGIAYPPAEVVLKVLTQLLDLVGYLGTASDPFARINERLDALQQRITRIESEVGLLRGDFLRERNWQRLVRLKDSRNALKTIASALALKPADASVRKLLVGQAEAEAEKFLDLDLWSWSDLALRNHQWPSTDGTLQTVPKGKMLDPDFKPVPTLEYYATALVIWMVAIEYTSNGDAALVQREHGAKLQEHIAFLSARPDFATSSDQPRTLPEHLQHRLRGSYEPEKFPRDRICTVDEYVRDDIARQIRHVQALTYTAASANELCNVPQGLVNRPTSEEERLIRGYGADLMALLAQKLTRLKDRGTVREAVTGVFDPTIMTPQFLYAVDANGDLLWRRHGVQTRRTPANTGARPSTRGPIGAGGGGILVAGLPVEEYIPAVAESPNRVGNGWDFKHLSADSEGVIYAVGADDKLYWYRHKGYGQGAGLETDGAWAERKEIGVGWGGFTHVFAAGEGVIYALDPQGSLWWYKHDAHLTGAGLATPGAWSPRSRVVVRHGLTDVKKIFSGGQGIIYVITQDDRLLWYRHNRYLDAVRTPETVEASRPEIVKRGLRIQWERSWEGPKEVGSGWGFAHVFSSGGGDVYAVTKEGKLLWYKHLALEGGGPVWWQDANGQQFKEIAAGLNDVRWAFAVLPGKPGSGGPVVR